MIIRHDWSLEELETLYAMALLELIFKASQVHTAFQEIGEVPRCHHVSIKTGGYPEDCKYCAQSSRYKTPISAPNPMMSYDAVLEAKQQGATRICLGAVWREVRDSQQFEEIIKDP